MTIKLGTFKYTYLGKDYYIPANALCYTFQNAEDKQMLDLNGIEHVDHL